MKIEGMHVLVLNLMYLCTMNYARHTIFRYLYSINWETTTAAAKSAEELHLW